MKFKKLKRFIKKNPFGIPIIVLSLIIILLIGLLVTPTIIQYITNEGDSGDEGDSDIINPWYLWDYATYVTTFVQEEWEEIIYVHQDGDNLTGGYSWDAAYTDLPSAIAYAAGTPFYTTLILVGAGDWDVCNPIAQVIDRQIILVGGGRDATRFLNTHPLATSVFKVEDRFSGYRFTVLFEDTCDGIVVENNIMGFMREPDINLKNVAFIPANVSVGGSPNALSLGPSNGGFFTDLHFDSLTHACSPVAINISGSFDNHFESVDIHGFKTAIRFDLNNSDYNFFHTLMIFNGSIGIDINAGNYNHFHNVGLQYIGIPFDDEVGDSFLFDINVDILYAAVQPGDLTGVLVSTGGPANTWGANTLVYDGLTNDAPFYLIAIVYEPNTAEKYGLRVSLDFGVSYIVDTIIEAKFANIAERFTFTLTRLFNAHSRVWISVKSESGGDDIDAWMIITALD
jgi:hypothetical protein